MYLKSRAHNIMLLTLGVSGSAIALLSLKPLKMLNSKGPFFLGYQSVIVGGIRDPLIIGQIDDWTEKLRNG